MKIGSTDVGIIALFILSIQSSRANVFVPLEIGLDFVVPFGESDILRGFKQNIKEGENPFRTQPFDGEIKTRPFATEFVNSYLVRTKKQVEDSIEVSGTMKASFGPISGEGSATFIKSKIKTKYKAEIVYTRRSLAYSRFVDLATLQNSVELVALCGDQCDDSTIASEYGTKFVDQVIYGAQLDLVYIVTSEYELDADELEAHVKGNIVGIKAEKKIKEGDRTSFSKYKVSIKAKASGVHFHVPTNPSFEQANQLIAKFSAQYEEVLYSLSSLDNLSEETNVLKQLAPIGFTLLSISDYLGALDADSVAILDRKMEEVGNTLFDSIYRKEKLFAVMDEEKLSSAVDDPRSREGRFDAYQEEVNKMMDVLDKLISECLDYRQMTFQKIIAEDPPLALGESDDPTIEKTYNALAGLGYIPAPFEIENMLGTVATYENVYYTGFALPDRDSDMFKLMPYFSGSAYWDDSEEIVTRGNTTDDIYKSLAAIISPTGLPPNQIGYGTPFVMALPSYKNEEGEEVSGVYYTTGYDDASGAFVPKTHYGFLFFCDDSPLTAQLQMTHKPADLYDVKGRTKTSSHCVKYGDIVYLAIGSLSYGKIFLKARDDTETWAPVEFGIPLAAGAGAKEYQWKVQSTIPFDGDVSTEDPLSGRCIEVGNKKVYNVIFQNMGHDKRWFSGGRNDEGGQALREKVAAVNALGEESPASAVSEVYRWQISNYEKARTDMLCNEV